MKCFLMGHRFAKRLAYHPPRFGETGLLTARSSAFHLQFNQIQTGVPSVSSLTATAPKADNVKLRESDLIRQDVTDIYAGIRNALTGTLAPLIPIAQYYFNEDGKAIRPVITMCLAKAINSHLDQKSPTVAENQRKVCQILEMIHVAGLYHDDVIDKAESRRNKPSINCIWGVKHSIFAGDFILGRAMSITADISDEEVSVLLNTMIDHIVIGEIMQLVNGETEEERFDHYIDKTFKKTASLLAHSCQSVALLSGGDSTLQTMAFKIGRDLGMAFQLVDDILDFSATSAQLGKAAAVDMSQGLANAPVLFAAQTFPQLNAMIARRFQEPGDVETAFRLILRSDGLQRTKDLATQYCDEAVTQLARLSPSPYQQFLFTITHKLLNRMK
ncbi:all trans-polyprenyl-diphosphate synthase PDSS1-like [Daphnia carinata]|uniref:all trans-polyprenyl-diphosphate synthase PDSS1-like n=1 Tax=Daphnia carinata TaxID=120202 RepID=UPI00257EBB62|nr:all trans-polyprenyl-diphosphate synthase PDSS1-like [Daphnia carinata]